MGCLGPQVQGPQGRYKGTSRCSRPKAKQVLMVQMVLRVHKVGTSRCSAGPQGMLMVQMAARGIQGAMVHKDWPAGAEGDRWSPGSTRRSRYYRCSGPQGLQQVQMAKMDGQRSSRKYWSSRSTGDQGYKEYRATATRSRC